MAAKDVAGLSKVKVGSTSLVHSIDSLISFVGSSTVGGASCSLLSILTALRPVLVGLEILTGGHLSARAVASVQYLPQFVIYPQNVA